MLTALLLVLPVSWVYMLTKQRSGYDQSVVQTVIILPMTVAATVILVQNSLALAFTLAAIVAAVRFRNTLKDTKDAVYIFLAVGDPDLLAALAPHELEEVADRAARLQAYVMARSGDKKADRFNGMLLVHTTQPEAAQRLVEELLEIQAERWRLAEIVPAGQGRSTLEYLLRLRDEFLPATLLDALKGRGSPPVDAAE